MRPYEVVLSGALVDEAWHLAPLQLEWLGKHLGNSDNNRDDTPNRVSRQAWSQLSEWVICEQLKVPKRFSVEILTGLVDVQCGEHTIAVRLRKAGGKMLWYTDQMYGCGNYVLLWPTGKRGGFNIVGVTQKPPPQWSEVQMWRRPSWACDTSTLEPWLDWKARVIG